MKRTNFIIASALSFAGLILCLVATILFMIGTHDILLEFYLTIAKDNQIIVWIILVTGGCLLYLAKSVGEQ